MTVTMTLLPPDAPGRAAAHDEVHVRPARPLSVPSMTTQVTVLTDSEAAVAETAHLRDFAAAHGLDVESTDVGLTLELDESTGMSWERHGGYSLYTVHQPIDLDGLTGGADLLSLLPLPAGWLAAVPGRTLSAVQTLLLPNRGLSVGQAVEVAQRLLGNGRLLGSRLRDDSASLYTTFRMRPDGTSRFVILCDTRMTEGRAGRVTGALLDMERYRMLALLAYPTAREMVGRLQSLETRLADLTHGIEDDRIDDRELLDELIGLAALVENEIAAHTGSFDAANAYHAIVEQRIEYLRSASLPGLMGVFTFLRRRLQPALATVDAAKHRADALSRRVARTADVLRTRVEVTAEIQTQELLRELRRGQHLQLRLQQTVEGLSIAAISYYIVGLIGYLGKGGNAAGLPVDEGVLTALAIPIVVVVVWRTLHRVRRHAGDDAAANSGPQTRHRRSASELFGSANQSRHAGPDGRLRRRSGIASRISLIFAGHRRDVIPQDDHQSTVDRKT